MPGDRMNGTVIKPGSVLGQLTVVADSGKRKNGYRIWTCRCCCGGLNEVDKRTLLRGTIQDCGCTGRLRGGRRDITGKRYGLLTAEYGTGERARDGSYLWMLKCDCGGTVEASLHQLTAGCRRSCGCLSSSPGKDWIGARFGRLTVLAYADKQAGHHRWRCRCDCGGELLVSQSNLQTGHTKSCGCMQVELHRSRLKLIGGTSVLMLERRRGKLLATNSSGHTGVYQVNRTGKWAAQITFKRKTYFLGVYEKKEDAIRARCRAEGVHRDFVEWYYREYLPSTKRQEGAARGGGQQKPSVS